MYNSFGAKPFSWAGSTNEEIQMVGEKEGPVLILPIGSVEQDDHHLPVATALLLKLAKSWRRMESTPPRTV